METPIILVNFKSYKESLNSNGLKLAEICEEVAIEYGANVAVAPQHIDLREIKNGVDLPVFAQHIDPLEKAGAFTGHIIAENLKSFGVDGTLINHSEKKLDLEKIKKCVEIAKKVGLSNVCCAATPEEAGQIALFGPDFIAIEPTELIGSGISVSTSRPEIVTKSVEIVKQINPNIKVLCGAGITNGEDVRKAIELGTRGVLVASGIVKAADPRKVLVGFVEGLRQDF